MQSARLVMMIVLVAAAAASCRHANQLDRADPSLPRIEVEVDYGIAPEFGDVLAAPYDEPLLERLVRDAVDPWTDIGLRFYPVASELYGPTQSRPDYVMRVRVRALDVRRALEPVQAGGGSASTAGSTGGGGGAEIVEARVRSMRLSLEVELERRRPDAPRLVIGQSRGFGEALPSSSDQSHRFALQRHSIEINETGVTAQMMFDAAEKAARKAFRLLQPAIDRELRMLAREQG